MAIDMELHGVVIRRDAVGVEARRPALQRWMIAPLAALSHQTARVP